MLIIEVYSEGISHRARFRMKQLWDEGYIVNKPQMSAKKVEENCVKNIKIMSLHSIIKMNGYNPDEVHFETIPNQDQEDLAIQRTFTKKGKVYILGRKVHDWKQNTKQAKK